MTLHAIAPVEEQTQKKFGCAHCSCTFPTAQQLAVHAFDFIKYELRKVTMCNLKSAQDAYALSIPLFEHYNTCDTEAAFAGTASRMCAARMCLPKCNCPHISLGCVDFLR